MTRPRAPAILEARSRPPTSSRPCSSRSCTTTHDPSWEDRDRFVLSKGHAAPAYYAALAESGYFSIEELLTLRKLGSSLQGHPTAGQASRAWRCPPAPSARASASALGMALAAKLDRKAYRVYCLWATARQEGQIWEAAMPAAHYELDNVTASWTATGCRSTARRRRSCPWSRWPTSGRPSAGTSSRSTATTCARSSRPATRPRRSRNRPTWSCAHTVKGKGVSFMENAVSFHGKAPNDEETEKALRELGEDR